MDPLGKPRHQASTCLGLSTAIPVAVVLDSLPRDITWRSECLVIVSRVSRLHNNPFPSKITLVCNLPVLPCASCCRHSLRHYQSRNRVFIKLYPRVRVFVLCKHPACKTDAQLPKLFRHPPARRRIYRRPGRAPLIRLLTPILPTPNILNHKRPKS